MPTQLDLGQHITALAESGALLRSVAGEIALDAPVPTCPSWRVADLVTHQGMVHRWAAANLRGEDDHQPASSQEAAAAASDLLAWYDDGLDDLLTTLRETPDDANAMVFLKDAPAPKQFWARRQAHETTMHGVDAISAALGRSPQTVDVTIPAELASDGIDELLCGFVPRRKGKLRSSEPFTVVVRTSDTGHAWTLHVSDAPVVTTVGASTAADATLSGTAVQLYLGLWNRGDEIVADGRLDVLDQWRSHVQVRWG
ncbi:maleylpyruvate isomerase family mycothiol-dependent enzyme [Actinobacteria bacterium YIM 96077]|uniref:Maleylpyruvate isomerase family mycothiol-dependent enzyme n=1 Tax=Phytoactinopolyspora halophila TaxID=1981511 RepID=A0A329QXN4_9ACTN|nr:maleylpyruvate isomerase family mycothiol-dependent enzyme [Phytoactinopolyspora halophila]AYY14941.1 maleylpyruvate isomerase family mycothiol-dependent enzyme [Actinobacteria bacterium YIM 96077]RAW15398.1 maleylpyruvate isomerase family mycothiol-dependent enzyme [Phytoactinopolyspora halophila]